MKARALMGSFAVATAGLWACSPISPSVHKSTLRPDIPSSPPAAREALEDSKPVPIEPRWLSSEQGLNSALEGNTDSLVVRLSSLSIDRIRKDGEIEIELPSELSGAHLSKARILLRALMEPEGLEEALAQESWSFHWDDRNPRVLRIQSSSEQTRIPDPTLPDALVSIHIVLQTR